MAYVFQVNGKTPIEYTSISEHVAATISALCFLKEDAYEITVLSLSTLYPVYTYSRTLVWRSVLSYANTVILNSMQLLMSTIWRTRERLRC